MQTLKIECKEKYIFSIICHQPTSRLHRHALTLLSILPSAPPRNSAKAVSMLPILHATCRAVSPSWRGVEELDIKLLVACGVVCSRYEKLCSVKWCGVMWRELYSL